MDILPSSSKPFAVLVTVVILLAVGCTTVAPATPTAVTVSAPSEVPTTPGIPTPNAATAEPSPTDAHCFNGEELAAMDLETIAAWDVLCYRSDSGIDTPVDQQRAVLAVRSLVGDAPQIIAFQEITRMANSPSGDLKVLRFVDERGYAYLVAPLAGKVVEMDPPFSLPAGRGPARSLEELQRQAEALILDQYPAFTEWKSALAFEAGHKPGGLYFFRWERALPWAQNMPALAQVGITETGDVFSYLNTLFYLRPGPPYPTLPAAPG